MKLINYTVLYVTASLFFIIGVWAVIFYFTMLEEIYDSIDDGLDNYKMLIIEKAENDQSILHKSSFDESNYRIREIQGHEVLQNEERYFDTLMYMQNENDFEPVRGLSSVFLLDTKYYELTIISSMVEEDDLIEDLSLAIVILFVVIIMSVLLINHFIIKRVWKPFYQVTQYMHRFNLKTPDKFEHPETNINEFRNLNRAIENLMQNALEAYGSQKQFIENAAHELQTPLMVCMNKLELLIEKDNLNEEQATILTNLMQNLEHMKRLNQSLLLITKIENKQFSDENVVNFNEVIKEQLRDFQELIELKKLDVKFIENHLFQHSINRDLVLILLSNLLKNALVHNSSSGTVEIVVTESSIRITNSGSLEELDKNKLFQRFYKASGKTKSTGLGMSIAKSITDLYQLKLQYSFDGKHNFVITRQ
ncbi:MAG: HAMP domain-containing histidine kinase [Crocinitomicaceae bacterium]|jgi:signal transduction histidine kinase|nr:HAMP domain-containing histidine kinase [Crocinitomicaceae bacterium]